MDKRTVKVSMIERIRRGASFLTKRLGKGWESRINVETLDINLPKSCMLGQTDSDFFEHQKALKISDLKCAHLGFLGYSTLDANNKIALDSTSERQHMASENEHRKLTKSWRAYLLLAGLR